MRAMFEHFDVVRIDHFRGFEAFWEVPGDDTTAVNGRWVKGPGDELFDGDHAGARAPADRRREPRPDHAGGRGAAREVRLSRG
jgi:hypothetical protein